jgi:protein gp37
MAKRFPHDNPNTRNYFIHIKGQKMKTKIEWTDESSNPIKFRLKETGKRGWACVKVADGCKHCYSERMNKRFGTMLDFTVPNMNLVEPYLDEKELARLLKLKGPKKVFLCDMSDLFGIFMRPEHILRVFETMAACPSLTFQILTKRPGRMCVFCNEFYPNPLPNVWLGTSISAQKDEENLEYLLKTPAAVRFVSCEPLLGAVDLEPWLYERSGCLGERANAGCIECAWQLNKLDWVIAGGESGKNARPMHPDWARSLVRQCSIANVPIFVKQMGSAWAKENAANSKGGDITEFPTDLRIREFPANHSSEQEL